LLGLKVPIAYALRNTMHSWKNGFETRPKPKEGLKNRFSGLLSGI
jgi:hypothetical protein